MKLIVSQSIFIYLLGAHFVQLAPLFGSEKGLEPVSGGITGISSIPGSLSKGGSASTSAVRSVKGNGRDSDKLEEDKSSYDEKSATTATDSDLTLTTDLGGDDSGSGLEPVIRKDHKTSMERKKGSGSFESEDGLESGSSSGHRRSSKGDSDPSEVKGHDSFKKTTDNLDSSTKYLETSDLPSVSLESLTSDFVSGTIKDSDSDSAFESESASNKKEKHKDHTKHNSSSQHAHHNQHGHHNQHNHQGNHDHEDHQGHSSHHGHSGHHGRHTHHSGHSHHNSTKTDSASDSQKSGSEGEPVDDFYESISAASSSATSSTTTTKSPKLSETTTEVTITVTPTSSSETNSTTIAPETVTSTDINVGQSEKNATTAAKNLTSSSWSPFSSSSSSSSSFASTEKPLSGDSEDGSWSNLFAGSYWDKSKIKARAESKSTPSPSSTTTNPTSTVDMNGPSNDTLVIDLSSVKPSPKVKSEINNILIRTYSKSKELISNLVQTLTQSVVNIVGLLNKKE